MDVCKNRKYVLLTENSLDMEVEQNEKFILQHKGQMGFYQAVPA